MFAETEYCKSRAHCVACRNNKSFRDKLSQDFGEIVCPLNIPINTSAAKMPQEVLDIITLNFTGPAATSMARSLRRPAIRARVAIQNLIFYFDKGPADMLSRAKELQAFVELVDNTIATWGRYRWPEALTSFAKDKEHVTAHSRHLQLAIDCLHNCGKTGVAKEQCCGGKTKDVTEYSCSALDTATDKRCRFCPRYLERLKLMPKEGVFDLLISVVKCDDCKTVKKPIVKLTKGRELKVLQFDDETFVRHYLDEDLRRSDLYVPALIVNFDSTTKSYDRVLDDVDEILEYLKAQGYDKA